MTRFGLGRDGKTPIQLLRGRQPTQPVCELGECVQFKPSGTNRSRGKLQTVLQEGVFLGNSTRSGEYYCGNELGLFKARDVYRRAPDERFNMEQLSKVRCTPWCPHPVSEEECELPEYEMVDMPSGEQPSADDDGYVPRNMRITKAMLQEFGYTRGCEGCSAVRLGRVQQSRSKSCRERIER